MKKKQYLSGLLLTTALIFLDQFTKYAAIQKLKGQPAFSLISNTLEFQYLENRGAAFGMLRNAQWLFILFAAVIIVGCIIWYVKLPAGPHYSPLRVCIAFLAAGAAGNLIDRIVYGYVVDFIYFRIINFPIFNVADICVTCSAAALILLVLFRYHEDPEI